MRFNVLAAVSLVPVLVFGDVKLVDSSPRAEFGKRAIVESGVACAVEMRLTDDPELKAEGFRLSRDADTILISARDASGLMYGGLEVAELLRTAGLEGVKPGVHNPYMAMRGIKMNAPLDARTPSYTDPCDAAQLNISEMWSMAFWKEQIDTLASMRYNFISIWNLHPFPSLVKVPGYEKVALDDVWRSRTIRSKEHYAGSAVGIVSPDILRDAEVVKKMTIDEKIAFWREVMAYGKSRGVDFYFVTWNIFTDAAFGKYGITDKADNETTRDYFRRSVAQMFLTYPDLAGIGLTTGENMYKVPFEEKENWAFETYGQGVLDAARTQPGRKIRFIHRQHMASAQAVLDRFKPLVDHPDIDFIFSFKYAKAHVYSSTRQVYHQAFVKDLEPRGVKTIWTLRNDDTYCFRWGAPDFVREFVRNIPYDVSQGYYFGSDQWIWGREFLERSGSGQGELELKKHGYQWMLWGRMAYDPDLSNDRIIAWLADRYGLDMEQAGILFNAWQGASMVYPTVTGFHWGPLDFQWYIEACQGRPGYTKTATGFHDVNRFITLAPHKASGFQSIPDYVAGKNGGLVSPPAVADRLDALAEEAEDGAAQLKAEPGSELERTLADIRIVAGLGHYYAQKIRGATLLATFRKSGDPKDQQQAIRHLVAASKAWKRYTERVLAVCKNPLWTNRVGLVDFKATYRYTLDDIRTAGGDPAKEGLPLQLDTPNEPIAHPWEVPGLKMQLDNRP